MLTVEYRIQKLAISSLEGTVMSLYLDTEIW